MGEKVESSDSEEPLQKEEGRLGSSEEEAAELATILEFVDFEASGHDRGSGVVLKFSESAWDGALVGASLLEVGDLAQVTLRGVVRQADVEEARVLLGDELVHVVGTGPHIQLTVLFDGHQF